MRKKILNVMLTSLVLAASVCALTGCGASKNKEKVFENASTVVEGTVAGDTTKGDTDDAAEKYADLPEWTNLEITILGQEYKLPCKVSDILDKGWEIPSLHQEEIEGTLGASGSAYFSLDKPDDNCKMFVFSYNPESIEGLKVVDSPIYDFSVKASYRQEIPEVDFYGLKLGDSIETIEGILGTPYEKTDKFYRYRQEVSEEMTAMVVINFDDDTKEIEEFSLYYVPTEDFID